MATTGPRGLPSGFGLQPSLQLVLGFQHGGSLRPSLVNPQLCPLTPQPAAQAEVLSNVRALLASSRQWFPALWHEPGGLVCC